MGDWQVGETIPDRWYVIETATGNPWLLQVIPVVVIDESGNRAAPANATEEGNGWYKLDVTPDAAGMWSTEAALAGATFVNNYIHYFKVGGGEVTDIKTETATILADTNELQTDLKNGGRLDLIFDGIQSDVIATDGKVDIIDAFHDVPVEDAAGDVTIRDVVGKKSDTVAGTSIVSILKQILMDTGTTLDDLVDDLESRLTAARAGYIDKLANRFQTFTFASDMQPAVTVTAAAPNLSLPTVTLPNWAGTIVHVFGIVTFRMVGNTNGAANKIDTDQYIQVQKGAGAFTNIVKIPDDVFGVAATTREGGGFAWGNIDVVGTVDVFNQAYNFQWTAADADLANLVLNDVQTFLIVSYY